MARLWARTTSFESVNVGDELPILVKWETAETIAKFDSLMSSGAGEGASPPAEGHDSAVANAASQALVSYVTELLEKGFPLPCIVAKGSSVSLRMLEMVKPEDTISLMGTVVDKGSSEGVDFVECLVQIENQDNVPVAEARAVIVL